MSRQPRPTSKQPAEETELMQRQQSSPTRITRHDQDRAFADTLNQAQSHMHLVSRLWSRCIHYKPLDILSSVIGSTLARPNAILYGSLVALVTTVAVYGVAKYYGYQLSGSEPLIALGFGWLIGTIIDYTALLIRGGKERSKRRG